MRILIVLAFLSICNGSNDFKLKNRGISEGLFLGGIHDLDSGIDLPSYEVPFQLNHDPYFANLELAKYDYGVDLGSTIHKDIIVTNDIGVPVLQPYAIPIKKRTAVPVPHPVIAPVDKPYPVQIPKPYVVPIEKPYPVTVEKAVPYHKDLPVRVPVSVPVAVVPVPKPVPVPIHKAVPYAVAEYTAEPVNVFKAAAIAKTPIVAIGSGSLGYTHLGNGAYALGSGSLGISGQAVNGPLNSISKLWSF